MSKLLSAPTNQTVNIQDQLRKVDTILMQSERFGTDTLLLKKTIIPLIESAKKKQDIPLLWAYYMQMADGFSLAIDNTNAHSDHYYDLANKLVKKYNYPELEMTGLIRQGYYNFIYRKVIEAFPFYLQANDLKSKINVQKVPLMTTHYEFMASFFSYIGEQTKSIEYLKEALPFSPQASRVRINIINSIAINYDKAKNKVSSHHYLQQALQVAELAKDSVWIGIIAGNLSNYAWQNGDTTQAIYLIKKNIDLSIRHNEPQDAMRANLVLAKYFIALKEWLLALQHIQISKELMKQKPYYLQYQMDAQYALSKIAKGLRNKDDELNYLNSYLVLRDSLEARKNVKEMQSIIWQSERDKYDYSMQEAEVKRQQIRRTFLYIVILSILIFCIILLLINKSKAKIKIKNTLLEKEQLTLTYEKQLVDQELIILKNSLEDFTNTIKQNDTVIKRLRYDIATDSEENPKNKQVAIERLSSMLEAHIMTTERWTRFKSVFDKVYPDYLNRHKEAYEKITDNDLKIIALQKLDLNNNTMSELLCISVEGIKKAKQRLKKKMETR